MMVQLSSEGVGGALASQQIKENICPEPWEVD